MKLKISLSLLIIGAIAFAVFSTVKNPEPFAPAADFPREGALVYVQVEDLPAFIKLWNESSYKEKFAQSKSFDEFKNNHLGRKLASRLNEFSDAAGFPIDLESIAGLAQNKAVLAVYDVGKLEFVFVAPVSEEVFAATKFAMSHNKFEEQTLGDGTTIYRTNVEADRGRQKQELIFCHANGRFILATNEKLMVQTLRNVSGARSKSGLLEAPAFSTLKDKITPHLATVWVNQTALNEDYFFKRYWLMPENEKLENIRAGVFDLAIEENRIIENRKFLLENAVENRPVDKTEADAMIARLPESIPFYQLRSADAATIDDAVQKTFFDREKRSEKKRRNYFSGGEFFNHDEYYSSGYESLSGKFDEAIDDEDDENDSPQTSADKETKFSEIIGSAQARGVLTFAAPQILPAPLFLRFDRAAVIYLAAPEKFNRNEFEKEIARKFERQTMIAAPGVNFEWQTVNENNSVIVRTLALPMLGISASYAVQGNEMILSSDIDFLSKVLAVNASERRNFANDLTSLSVINLDERKRAYHDVFSLLAEKKAANDFFSGSVESFIASLDNVRQIEITENYSGKILEERLTAFR